MIAENMMRHSYTRDVFESYSLSLRVYGGHLGGTVIKNQGEAVVEYIDVIAKNLSPNRRSDRI